MIVDGSRRVTLRNREFLKKIVTIARKNDLDPGPSQLTNETTPDLPIRLTPNTSDDSPDTSMYSNELPNENRVEHPNAGKILLNNLSQNISKAWNKPLIPKNSVKHTLHEEEVGEHKLRQNS